MNRSFLTVMMLVSLAMLSTAALAKPVGIWSMDEGRSYVVRDSSGLGNDGYLANWPTWVSGQYEGGMAFNGADEYVEIEDDPSLRPGTLTVVLWVRQYILWDTSVIAKQNLSDANACNWQVTLSSKGNVGFSYYNGVSWTSVETSTGPITADEWHHVVVVFKGGDITIYVDGTGLVDTSGHPALDTSYTGKVLLGRGYDTFRLC